MTLVKFPIKTSTKFLFGALVVLTQKGTRHTTVSNLYLGETLNKTSSQISVMLKELKDKKFIKVYRELGRRRIELNTKALIDAELMTEPKKGKNAKK